MSETPENAKYVESLAQELAAVARRIGMSEAAYYLEIAAASAGESLKRTGAVSRLPRSGRV
jgi:hypothetical protein